MDNYINLLILIIIIYYLYNNIASIKTIENFNSTSILLSSPPDELILNTNISTPTLRLATAQNNTYPYQLGLYFRHNIYPTKIIITKGSVENIKLLLNNEVDLAFVDEDILVNIILEEHKKQPKQLLNIVQHNSETNSIFKDIHYLAMLYYQYLFGITKKGTNIVNWDDLNNRNVGVLDIYSASNYHLYKLIKLTKQSNSNFNPNIITYDSLQNLALALKSDEIEAIYITTNQKNFMLRDLSDELELRFISPFHNTLNTKLPNNQKELQKQYLARIQFKNLFDKTLNLNYFYKNINLNNHIKTKASRMILVASNKLKNNTNLYEILVKNFISNINGLQKHINSHKSDIGNDRMIMNDITDAFKFEDQASINKEIEIHTRAKKIYKKLGLIQEIETKSCKI